MKKTVIIVIFTCALAGGLFVNQPVAFAQYYDDFGYGGYYDGGYGFDFGFGFDAYCGGYDCGGYYGGGFDYYGGCGFACGGPIIAPPIVFPPPPPIIFPPPIHYPPQPPVIIPPPVVIPPPQPPVIVPPPVIYPPQPPVVIPPPHIQPLPPVFIPQPYPVPQPVPQPYPVPVPVPAPQPACSVQFDLFNPPLIALPGHAYAYTAHAAAASRVTYRLSGAPAGMTIDSSTGRIAWTPRAAQVGRHTVTVVASANGCEAARSFAITVESLTPPPAPAPKPACCTCVVTCAVGAASLPQPAPGPCASAFAPANTAVPPAAAGASIIDSVTAGLLGIIGGIGLFLSSPVTLFFVILVLLFLLFRAYRRSREVEVGI
jgi:hypothetical protein